MVSMSFMMTIFHYQFPGEKQTLQNKVHLTYMCMQEPVIKEYPFWCNLGVVHNYQHFHKCTKSTLFQTPLPPPPPVQNKMLISNNRFVFKSNVFKGRSIIYSQSAANILNRGQGVRDWWETKLTASSEIPWERGFPRPRDLWVMRLNLVHSAIKQSTMRMRWDRRRTIGTRLACGSLDRI